LVSEIETYEDAREDENDRRHRMVVNGVAAAVTAVLIIIGVWTSSALLDTTQDTHTCPRWSGSSCTAYFVPGH
jgi:hypothetical protein